MSNRNLREQIIAAFRKHNDFAPATYYLRNSLDKPREVSAAQVREELERMERDGLVRKYLPKCRANQLHWQLIDKQ